ncbi:MarR family transcriptional regulator [Fictibacillus nanhaiensis]|uniref:MarR family winged helix-turn-helix transcriptional regulator n=1 Tax=Fictibacillus nanhaiensis TaxID=742169 RepID=UPI001C940EAE|nr:MarR family transcriptional regulator [Fictibacillus nanhaiensis]MBY6036631.1 MarR family transcriptional regulator [Fictibacillus nanhaiensis]
MSEATLLNQYWTDIYFHLHYPHKEKISHQVIRILQLIEKKENVGVNDVAICIQVSHNTASEHVKRMLDKQYLNKRRDSQDERKVVLGLTDLGREVLHQHTSLDEEKLKHILKKMNDEELHLIIKALKLLSERAQACT